MIDPVCGMEVTPSKAAGKHDYNGQSYYFCSHHCLAKFKEEPENFLKPPGSRHAAPGHGHGHENVVAPSPQLVKTEERTYVCPMDPEVRESKPGACPKCGMAWNRQRRPLLRKDRVRLPHASGNRP